MGNLHLRSAYFNPLFFYRERLAQPKVTDSGLLKLLQQTAHSENVSLFTFISFLCYGKALLNAVASMPLTNRTQEKAQSPGWSQGWGNSWGSQ